MRYLFDISTKHGTSHTNLLVYMNVLDGMF